MTYPKIYVISLKHSTERREYISARLKELGISFKVFDAVNGRTDQHELLENYNDKNRLWQKGHSLTLGEQGCFASHQALWNICKESSENIIILEDDVNISDNFPAILQQITELGERYDYIRLGRGSCARMFNVFPAWIIERALGKNYNLVKYLKGPSCAHAYFLTPTGAKRFLSKSQIWWWPVDDYMDKEYLHGQCNHGIEPPLVNQRGVVSEIGGVKKPKRTVMTRIRKEVYRFTDILSNNVFNLKYLLKNKR